MGKSWNHNKFGRKKSPWKWGLVSLDENVSPFHWTASFYLQKKKEEGIIDSSDKEIVAEAERLDVKAMGPLVLTEVLFNEKIREQIKKYRRHFLRVSKLFLGS